MLIPLLVAAFAALATSLFVLQRKSLAQSVCVQSASALSQSLGQSLGELMALNTRARALRRQRTAAEAARAAALASLNGPALAAAEATLAAIQLAQMALDARQRTILMMARMTRQRGQADFRARAARLRGTRVTTEPRFAPALAVRARPPAELAPEYEEADDFSRRQRQTFAFDLELTPAFARGLVTRATQRTACVTTLKRKANQWRNQIVEASAPSNSR